MKHSVLIRMLDFNLKYAEELVKDVPEDKFSESGPSGLENHPLFTIGHLVTALGLTIKYLGKPYDVPEEWDNLFRRKGPGDPRMPEVNSGQYPLMEEVFNSYRQKTNELKNLLEQIEEDSLEEDSTWRFSSYFPTKKDLIYFMVIEHTAMHLGQLAAWRRSKNFPSALGRI